MSNRRWVDKFVDTFIVGFIDHFKDYFLIKKQYICVRIDVDN